MIFFMWVNLHMQNQHLFANNFASLLFGSCRVCMYYMLYVMLFTRSHGEFVVILQSSGYIQPDCCAHNLLFNVLPIAFFHTTKSTNTESVLTWKQSCKPSVWLL